VKREYSGITLIEILMVAGIIVVLAGLLIPAMTFVRKTANVTKQRAELNTIELAITTFKNDDGDYPPSTRDQSCERNANDYSGAQKLAEALCGWDLLGFHPDSRWCSDGRDCAGGTDIYRRPLDPANNAQDRQNLQDRRGPYLDMTHVSAFRVQDLFSSTNMGQLANTYVLCDVFGVRNVVSPIGKIVKAGTPILYYKANPASRYYDIVTGCTSITDCADRIYDFYDNQEVIDRGKLTPNGATITGYTSPLDPGDNGIAFYNYIQDRRISTQTIQRGWPYNPESYILISAGPDGEYGTKDDICNFPTP